MTTAAPEVTPEVDPTVTTNDAGPEAGEESKQEGQEPEAGTETGDASNSVDELPKWAQDEIKNLRSENASKRVKLKDAEDKLKSAKTPEEYEAAVTEWRTKYEALEQDNLRGKIARDAGLPEHWAKRLEGSTPEELAADAKAIAADLGRSDTADPKGGLDPNDDDGEGGYDVTKIANSLGGARRI